MTPEQKKEYNINKIRKWKKNNKEKHASYTLNYDRAHREEKKEYARERYRRLKDAYGPYHKAEEKKTVEP
jgi:hypothetical protein